ncbi:MAG: ribosomal L7Ae/L30e/S12e/Gadd45 family protein [Phascolarctobacterium sp.]|nr:ribosomal L7Ae/L30e/S12e/Gadd45 family protein [Phascolarctobacterium sp.]
MTNNQVAFALGLAQKAGKAASGDFAVRGALKAGKVKLLVIATDTAENTKKELLYLAEQAKVEVKEFLTKAELGYAIGKAQRTAVAIMDENFAKMLRK